MRNDRSWLAPLTGVLFIVLVVIAFAIGGEPPSPSDESAQEIIDFYQDNEGEQIAAAALAAVGGTLFVFFGGYLRRVLRDAEGDRGILSAVAFAGIVIFALGIALDSTITFALADTADDIDPTAAQALSALWNNDFVPFAMGIQIFLFATGISVIRHGALPKWIGWIAILIAIVAVTPIGFAAFLGSGVLVLIMSVVLTMRARSAPATGA